MLLRPRARAEAARRARGVVLHDVAEEGDDAVVLPPEPPPSLTVLLALVPALSFTACAGRRGPRAAGCAAARGAPRWRPGAADAARCAPCLRTAAWEAGGCAGAVGSRGDGARPRSWRACSPARLPAAPAAAIRRRAASRSAHACVSWPCSSRSMACSRALAAACTVACCSAAAACARAPLTAASRLGTTCSAARASANSARTLAMQASRDAI
jgi:hypothetical protein